MLIITPTGDSQPQEAISLARSELTRGALHWWLLNPSTGYRDLVGSAHGTPTAITPTAMPFGIAAGYSSGTSAINVGDPSGVDFGTGPLTIGVRFRANSVSTRQMLLAKDDDSLGRQFHLQIGQDGPGSVSFVAGVVTAVFATSSVSAGVDHTVIYLRSGSDHRIFVDGVQKASTTNGAIDISAQSAPLLIGARSFSGFPDPISGHVEQCFILNRAWSEQEVRAHHARPYEVFEPRRIFIPMASAGGGFTLALDAGSYTYTGQNTGLAVSRKLAFNAGSYAYTGQATTLSYGRRLSLDAGSYSYTGQTTGLAVSRKLPLEAGSYSITGNDVTLTYDSSTDTYTISLDAGSYTYTGQTTDFKVSRKLSFDAGVYSYTGQTTNFAVGRKLSLDSGSYAYTGQATTFVVNRNLALDSGAYTYTGQAAGLAYSGSTGFVTIKAGSWLRYRVI